MTVDIKTKIYAVVWNGAEPGVALFSRKEDAICEIVSCSGKETKDWEYEDGAILEDEDQVMFIRECELN